MTIVAPNAFTTGNLILKTHRQQKGIALVALMFLVTLAVTGIIISALNSNRSQLTRVQADNDQLQQAKMALLIYAISVSGAGQRPGDLVRPDILSEGTPNYDGLTDSGCLDATAANGLPSVSSGANMRCLGRFPWKDTGLSIESSLENDPDGRVPWLAISANLVDPACLFSLNSDTLSLPYNGYACTGESVPHPWLTVRDSLGNVLSDRVAAVIIIPGPAIGDQERPDSPNLGGTDQYLDSITVRAGCAAPHVAGTYTNAGLNNEFIQAQDATQIADDDPCYQHPYQFNDKLIYITIEELMAEVEKKVAGEARIALQNYNNTNGVFPDAATVGYQGQSCVAGSSSGFLPMPLCRCTNRMCDCAFPGTIIYTSDKNFSSALDRGSCISSAKTCTCTGAGSCSRTSSPARKFVCTRMGTCVGNVSFDNDMVNPVELQFNPDDPPIDTSVLDATGGCTITGATAKCNDVGTVTATSCAVPEPLANFPDWFTENGWKHFIYYQTGGGLTVGARSNVETLLITTGQPLNGQVRPSTDLPNYLDGDENTNLDSTFDKVGKKRDNFYNDQMFIVTP